VVPDAQPWVYDRAAVCALVKPTIRARTRTPAIRGADPKRATEPRRAKDRNKREVALTARGPSGGAAPGIEERAEAASAATAATASTAPKSATQSRASIAIIRKREAGDGSGDVVLMVVDAGGVVKEIQGGGGGSDEMWR
jgi:hypothetical protein